MPSKSNTLQNAHVKSVAPPPSTLFKFQSVLPPLPPCSAPSWPLLLPCSTLIDTGCSPLSPFHPPMSSSTTMITIRSPPATSIYANNTLSRLSSSSNVPHHHLATSALPSTTAQLPPACTRPTTPGHPPHAMTMMKMTMMNQSALHIAPPISHQSSWDRLKGTRHPRLSATINPPSRSP
jgi:hypothetical protein